MDALYQDLVLYGVLALFVAGLFVMLKVVEPKERERHDRS